MILTINGKNLFKFATKLTAINYRNLNEIKIAQQLSEITFKDENPHFLLIYKTMICNNTKDEIYTSLPKLIKNNDFETVLQLNKNKRSLKKRYNK